MNKLSTQQRAQILGMMVEGMSIRAISRLTGASKNTIAKLLVDAGKACAEYQDGVFRKLSCRRLQVDEIWSFVYAKAKNVPEDKQGEAGDVWTWTAIDADTKLVPSFYLGDRSGESAKAFISDLASRLATRVQLTSDGLKAYVEAVDDAFGTEIDFAQLVKIYGDTPESMKGKYSPAECTGAKKTPITGNPDGKHISTSFVERQNLNIRMGNRRFTRLTNAFSKKIENHFYALAIYFMHYNFVRIHQTLRVSPAMAAGVSEKLWSLEDVVGMIDVDMD
ncbi:MAG: IS1 family transposase [Alphaproteobacteria bacterium]|nr:IS1 family transposase [Alphaproteobacteria bacterium]